MCYSIQRRICTYNLTWARVPQLGLYGLIRDSAEFLEATAKRYKLRFFYNSEAGRKWVRGIGGVFNVTGERPLSRKQLRNPDPIYREEGKK